MLGTAGEIQDIWADIAESRGLEVVFEPELDELLTEVQAEAREHLHAPRLAGYIDRLMFAIEWLARVHASLDLQNTKLGDNRLFPFLALSARALNQVLAVRQLVECGLGSPARAMVRSLAETLCTILLLAARPELVEEFVAAQEFEQTRRFWWKHLRPAKVNSALASIEQQVTRNLDVELSQDFRTWREDQMQRLSTFVHPTYVASVISLYPDSARKPQFGAFGAASLERVAALDDALRWVWYYSLLLPGAFGLPRRDGLAKYSLDPEEEIDRFVMVGRVVIAILVLRHRMDVDEALGPVAEVPT